MFPVFCNINKRFKRGLAFHSICIGNSYKNPLFVAAVRSFIRNSIFFYKILSGWVPNNNRRASQNKKRFFMTKLTMSNMNSLRSLFWHHNKAGYRHWDQYIRHRHLSSVQEQDRKSGFHPSPFLPSPPCNTHTHFISCWVRTFILFPPAFSPSLNSQRG